MTLKAASIVWKVLSYVSNYPFVSQSQDVHLRGVEGGPLPSALEHSPSSPSPVCSSVWPLTSPVSGAGHGHGHNLQTPPHQSAVLCGHWLHQWVEQDMVTTCRLKRSPGVLQWYCDATPSWSPPSIKGRTYHHLDWLRGCTEFYSGNFYPTPSMPPPIFSLGSNSKR